MPYKAQESPIYKWHGAERGCDVLGLRKGGWAAARLAAQETNWAKKGQDALAKRPRGLTSTPEKQGSEKAERAKVRLKTAF